MRHQTWVCPDRACQRRACRKSRGRLPGRLWSAGAHPLRFAVQRTDGARAAGGAPRLRRAWVSMLNAFTWAHVSVRCSGWPAPASGGLCFHRHGQCRAAAGVADALHCECDLQHVECRGQRKTGCSTAHDADEPRINPAGRAPSNENRAQLAPRGTLTGKSRSAGPRLGSPPWRGPHTVTAPAESRSEAVKRKRRTSAGDRKPVVQGQGCSSEPPH